MLHGSPPHPQQSLAMGIRLDPDRSWHRVARVQHNWLADYELVGIVYFASSQRQHQKAFAIRDRTGHYPKEAREALGWGVILLLVAGLFLFGLSWNVFWPVLVVGLGLRVIINNTLR